MKKYRFSHKVLIIFSLLFLLSPNIYFKTIFPNKNYKNSDCSFFINNSCFAQTLEGDDTDCIFCAQFVPECGTNEKFVGQTCKECAHCELITELPTTTEGTPSLTPQSESKTDSESTATPTETTIPNENSEQCQKCIIHSQCPFKHICINNCCIEKPPRKNRKSKTVRPCKSCESSDNCSKNETCLNKCCINKPTQKENKPIKTKTTESCIFCTQTVPKCKSNEKLIKQTCKKCAHCKKVDPLLKGKKTSTKKVKSSKRTQEINSKCQIACGLKCCKKGQKCITIDQCKEKSKPCKFPVLKFCNTREPDHLHGRLQPL